MMTPAKGRQSSVFNLIWSDDVYQTAERGPKRMKALFVGLYTERSTACALIRPQDLSALRKTLHRAKRVHFIPAKVNLMEKNSCHFLF